MNKLGKGKALIDVAKTIMWRTSKANVENEINIPPYSEIVHRITMSPHEALFYAKEHYQCRSRFLEKAETLAKQYVLCTINPKILSSVSTFNKIQFSIINETSTHKDFNGNFYKCGSEEVCHTFLRTRRLVDTVATNFPYVFASFICNIHRSIPQPHSSIRSWLHWKHYENVVLQYCRTRELRTSKVPTRNIYSRLTNYSLRWKKTNTSFVSSCSRQWFDIWKYCRCHIFKEMKGPRLSIVTRKFWSLLKITTKMVNWCKLI